MNLLNVTQSLKTEDECLDFIEKVRWPNGVRCPVCMSEKISNVQRKNPGKNKRTRLYTCLRPECGYQFSPTTGTLFHDSHLPLPKWFMAVALIVDAKKGMSAKQLQRHLQVSYRTAWYLAHRIREAMKDGSGPKLTGVVEIDETYIGGKVRSCARHLENKNAVIGFRERGGKLRFIQASGQPNQGMVYDMTAENVDKNVSLIVTDDSRLYNYETTQFRGRHKSVNHSAGQYVRISGKDAIHTNTIESAFSLLKRGIIGNFHRLSIKHLQRYLNEFSYRFNRRDVPDRFEQVVGGLVGNGALEYKKLVAEN